MRAVVVSGGVLVDTPRVRRVLDNAEMLICADRGAVTLLELGYTPTIVIGDMDSIDPAVLEAGKLPLLTFARRKDQTDTELALDYAIAHGAMQITILAALGGQRFDHALANVLLLSRPDLAACNLTLLDGMRVVELARPERPVELAGEPGDYVSLVPLDTHVEGVTTEGLEYPLQEAALTRGSTFSISNELMSRSARISVSAGLLVVIHEFGARR